jgi:hypothetical protein
VTAVSSLPDTTGRDEDLDASTGARSAVTRAFAMPRVVAWVVLACVLWALTLVNDPGGYLGTDTGGKVLTLEAMDRSDSWSPDIGYWAAEWDPDGDLHPAVFTTRFGDRWVNVTSLPAIFVARPLYAVAGYRGALLVPIAGAVACAAAARAIARRAGARTGWSAYWLVGLASPITIYALDFWEHTLGAALLGWALIVLTDVATGMRARGWAIWGGALVGLAATMRTEALAYGAAATLVAMIACALGVTGVRSRARVGVTLGGAVVAGMAAPLVANELLERAVLGGAVRSGRASSAIVGVGDVGARVREALVTGASFPGGTDAAIVLGVGAGLLIATLVSCRADAPRGRVASLAGCLALAVLVLMSDGLGFVPGLVPATPFAAAGVVALRRANPASRILGASALVALPLVWSTQWLGGALPQWGGRYILTSGLVLGALGVAAAARSIPAARWTVTACAVVITLFGVTWLSVRSHDVDDTFEALNRRPEPVLVSTSAFFAREAGPALADHRWLTLYDADDPAQRALLAEVLEGAGFESFALVGIAGGDDLREPIGTYVPTTTESLPFLADVRLDVTTYERLSG